MTLNLPKKRLSYSQWDLWLRSKEQYRARYYEEMQFPDSLEIIFGKKIATMLEKAHDSLNHIPRYASPEHRIETEVHGVPVLGFIDSFDPKTGAFLEYKTGRVPWDAVRVAKHKQLPFYKMLIEKEHGLSSRDCTLVWLETRAVEGVEDFGGMKMEGGVKEIELTGAWRAFPRKLSKWEAKKIAESVRDVAEEISEDYTRWQKSAQ